MKVVKALLVVALLPLAALALLALLGAREDVGVVTTGTGDHALLGAAWVATWLASVVVSPIAALAAALAAAALWNRRPAAARRVG